MSEDMKETLWFYACPFIGVIGIMVISALIIAFVSSFSSPDKVRCDSAGGLYSRQTNQCFKNGEEV